MKSSFHLSSRLGRGRPTALVVLAVVLALTGCGNKKEAAPSQTAAKVNKEELSVHQINYVLQRQQGLKPEQTDAAGKQILERLIEQELALQKAQDLKLDRDPRVVQALEAARREILSRAYLEKVGDAAVKPTPDEIRKFYEEKPALFKDRRIYNLQEITIEARPDQIDALRSQLQAAKSINDFVDHLKANNFRFAGNQAVRPAEQLPLNMLDTFAALKDGQAMLAPTASGAQVIALVNSRPAPVDEAAARPAIEQFLLNDRKKKLVESDIKTLRETAKIEYVGKFAEAAASGGTTAPAKTATVVAAPAATPASTAGGLNSSDISKGMGLNK